MNTRLYYQKNTSEAFSLIELLVVVAIIGILTSIILVSMTAGRAQKEVEGAASFATAKIREAQTAALTGKQQIANTTPCSYRVVWGSSNLTNSYVYKDGSGNCASVVTIFTSTLPSGVSFTGSGTADFVLPHGQMASAQIATLQKGSVTQVICLRINGLIEPEATASSC